MNKKIIFLICVIGITALLAISTASAKERDMKSSDSINITVKGIDFQIPSEYEGGRNASGDYVFGNVFTFGLMSLDTENNLRHIYGYESTNEEVYDVEEMEIDGHHAVAYYSNRSIVRHDVTYLFFESNETVYALSYDGNDVNDTMKDIVSQSPKSKWTKEEFDEKLNTAQEDYIEQQREYDEYYAYEQGYRNGYSHGSSNYNNHNDYLGYYFFYRLGRGR